MGEAEQQPARMGTYRAQPGTQPCHCTDIGSWEQMLVFGKSFAGVFVLL